MISTGKVLTAISADFGLGCETGDNVGVSEGALGEPRAREAETGPELLPVAMPLPKPVLATTPRAPCAPPVPLP